MEISTNNTRTKFSEHPHLLEAIPAPGYTGHDTRYRQLANPAPSKQRYSSTSKQPSTIPSSFLKNHHGSHGKKVRFAPNVTKNERKPCKTVSPPPRPGSPVHTAAMSKLALKASAGVSIRAWPPSTAPANTSRPMVPAPSRSPASSHLKHTPANTSASRSSPSPSTHVPTKRDHGTMKNTSTSSKSTHRAARTGSNAPQQSSKNLPPANTGSKRSSGLPHRPLNIPPPVPEAPRRQGPPPTPRPARLPTPDLEDISHRRFCACNNPVCRGYGYPHDHHGRRLSKMDAQSKTNQVLQSKSC
jgi:hypothetical protein